MGDPHGRSQTEGDQIWILDHICLTYFFFSLRDSVIAALHECYECLFRTLLFQIFLELIVFLGSFLK